MSNEPTPDAPDADPSAETSASATPDAEATFDAAPDTPFTDPDPTIDVMSDPEDPFDDTDSPDTDARSEPTTGMSPPQPPPYAIPPVRRLVRDPYSRLGGVCSGIAHHTGVDVSLVRLGFVLATLFSGIGLILYLLAWLIVPRAEYWPPAPYDAGAGGSALEGRQLAYGLLAIGIVLVIFSGAGGFARMVVSVGLVGAGIWLLVQPRSQGGAPAGGPPVGHPPEPVPTTWQPSPGHVGPDTSDDDITSGHPGTGSGRTSATSGAATGPAVSTMAQPSTSGIEGAPPPTNTVYVPSPVPPRRRRIWPFVLIGAILLIPVTIVAGGIAFLAAADEDFSETDVLFTPATPAEIPGRVDEGAGTITLDLTNLDVADFSGTEGSPQEIEVDLNAGEVIVELPPDFPVTVDASAGAGDITVFDRGEDGIRPRIRVNDEDALLDLDIRVGVGEITVDG